MDMKFPDATAETTKLKRIITSCTFDTVKIIAPIEDLNNITGWELYQEGFNASYFHLIISWGYTAY